MLEWDSRSWADFREVRHIPNADVLGLEALAALEMIL